MDFRTAGCLLILLFLSTPAAAQPRPADTPPDWPCVQVFVPTLSAATIWPGPPIDPYLKALPDHPELTSLALRVTARSMGDDEATEAIDRFAEGLTENKDETLTLLFAGIFDEANRARDKAVTGIRRFSRTQQEVLSNVEETILQLDAARAAKPPDEQRIRELSEQLSWQRRILEERNRSLTALCEQPGIVEGRLGRLARAIASHMDGQ
jgi:hypothetical protein